MTTSTASYIERIFLSRYSELVLAGSLNGFFLIRIFQASTLCVTIGGQAYIARLYGGALFPAIGPCVWQLIWFSLSTIFIVPPIGFAFHYLFYNSSQLIEAESSYFSLVCWFNFLTPLTGALSAFYIGRKKVAFVVFLTIVSALLTLGLDYVLIFGNSYVPTLGSFGAALSKVISQLLVCSILFISFLNSKNKEAFNTHAWKVDFSLFYRYIKPGLLRGLGTIPCLCDWFLISKTMTLLSDYHLRVFSIGSALFYFFTFFSDALFQTTVIATADQLGKNSLSKIGQTLSSALFFLALFTAVTAILFFLYPDKMITFFSEKVFFFQTIAPGIWLALMGYGLNLIALGVITAACDTLFLLKYYCAFWAISFLPIYITMVIAQVDASWFWYLVFFSNIVTACVFFWRIVRRHLDRDRDVFTY